MFSEREVEILKTIIKIIDKGSVSYNRDEDNTVTYDIETGQFSNIKNRKVVHMKNFGMKY